MNLSVIFVVYINETGFTLLWKEGEKTKTFEELLEEHRQAAERYCRFKLPTYADAEDVLSEVCLTAYRKFSQLRSEDTFKPWLIGIAKRKCADWYRKRAKLSEVPLEDISENELMAGSTSIAETVRNALNELRSKDRDVLNLYYFQELSQSQIAQKLNIPVGTVKSRLHTAREHFRQIYPYKPKGEKNMTILPEIMPEYKIEKLPLEPFEVKWEELPGWVIIPREGESLEMGLYDFSSRKRTEWMEMKVVGKAEVHGIEGVEIVAVQHDTEDYYRTGAINEIERRFIAQLTDTHCRFLAESHCENSVRKCYTFIDNEFIKNWGFGPDNCGQETNLARKGLLNRNGSEITGELKPDLQALDVVGRYNVTVNGKIYDTICVMDIECFNDSVASEQFIDKSGKTVLWRRFNRDDWAFHRYGKRWTELLPENETLTINGETYVHWYDCITDYIL